MCHPERSDTCIAVRMQCDEDLGFGKHETLRSQRTLPQSDMVFFIRY
jgi:hypothetical protein